MTDIDKSRNIVVGLDIGTTKISLMVGKMNEYKKLEIVAQGKSESYGVSRGIVANIDRTVESIKEAINQASQHYSINEVYVGIAGQHIKSLQHRGEIVRDDVENEINISDMKKLKDNMFKLITIPGE